MKVEIFLLPILIFPVEILMPGISPPIMPGFSTNYEQCLFSNYEQFFSLTSGVWKGACVFVYFGEHCETVHKFFLRVLRSTGVLCSNNTNVISCSLKLKSFYSSSSWSYSSMLEVALNKLQYIIQVS